MRGLDPELARATEKPPNLPSRLKKRGSKRGLTRRDGFLQDLEELSGRLVIHDHHNFRPKKRKLGKNGKMFRSEE